MHPVEFIMEMSGIAKLLGPDEAPTPAQWAKIHEMLAQTAGPLMARKLVEMGEESERAKADLMKQFNKPYPTIGLGVSTTWGAGMVTAAAPQQYTITTGADGNPWVSVK